MSKQVAYIPDEQDKFNLKIHSSTNVKQFSIQATHCKLKKSLKQLHQLYSQRYTFTAQPQEKRQKAMGSSQQLVRNSQSELKKQKPTLILQENDDISENLSRILKKNNADVLSAKEGLYKNGDPINKKFFSPHNANANLMMQNSFNKQQRWQNQIEPLSSENAVQQQQHSVNQMPDAAQLPKTAVYSREKKYFISASNLIDKHATGSSFYKKSDLQNLAQSPTQFYHLKRVRYQNYKYPRSPFLDFNEPESKTKMPIYLLPSLRDQQSIEEVFIQQEKKKLEVKKEVENSRVNSSKQCTHSSAHDKYPNKLVFQLNSDKLQNNLQDLEAVVKKKNYSHTNVLMRWHQQEPCQKNDDKTKFYAMIRTIEKSIDQTKKASQKNLKIIDIDRIVLDNSTTNHNFFPSGSNFTNSNFVSNKGGGGSPSQNGGQKAGARFFAQQNKSNRIKQVIESYNRLLIVSENIAMSGLNYESESFMVKCSQPLYNNEGKEVGEDEELQNIKQQLQKQWQKKKGVLLCVFVEHFKILYNNKNVISSRILLALGLNPNQQFSYVEIEPFLLFHRIFIHKDAPLDELINFVEQFFKVGEDSMSAQQFKIILRMLTQSIDERHTDFEKSLYEYMVENYELTQVLKKDQVDFQQFREVLIQNKMNIYDIIDLICGLQQ